MVYLACWEKKRFFINHAIVDCERGQLAWSQQKLAERWKCSRQNVRTFLNHLEKDEMIFQEYIQKSNHKIMIITICNYSKYQDFQPHNQPLANHKPTTSQPQGNPIQEYTEIIEDIENIENISISPKNPTTTITFDQFYSAYPKHVKRVEAEKSWKKLNGMDKSIIMEDIAKRKLSVQWQDKQFIPAPSAYLNGKRWEDEIIYDENNHHEPTRKRIVL